MEAYIPISLLNDYIFCPRSIYLHSVYNDFNTTTYHQTPQVVGRIKHENIENQTYSSAKRYLQAMPIYSEKYGLMGKIDIYDTETKSLIERKTKVNKIYDGYKYQLYEHYFCLTEMGYVVENMYVHSLTDNKRYLISLPDKEETARFEEVVNGVKEAVASEMPVLNNPAKCANCIYRPLCH